jgi:hypothetical protein
MTTNIFDHQVIHPRSPTRDSQKGPLFAPSQDWKYIGNLVQPLQELDDGSDWALIEIKNWEIPLENVVDSGKGDTPCQLHPRKIAPQNPQENEVIVATGLSGNLKGKVSGTPVNMLWPSSTEIQEFWIVRLEQNLGEIKPKMPPHLKS